MNTNEQPRTYRAPETVRHGDFTYNRWGGLGIVYGINVPFLTELSSGVYDEDTDQSLWSSDPLIHLLAESHDCFRNGDKARSEVLALEAIAYCNRWLPEGRKLDNNAGLRLTWAEYGIASITKELNNKFGYEMDVVKHGAQTMILNAPLNPDDRSFETGRMFTPKLFTATGTERPKPQPRQTPQEKRGGRGQYHRK